MIKLVIFLGIYISVAIGELSDFEKPFNISVDSDINKDMYVVHAMVYQLGIITNATDENDSAINNRSQAGASEALTFYHSNGSNIDLNKIPQQLLPNLTARNFIVPSRVESDTGTNITFDNITVN